MEDSDDDTRYQSKNYPVNRINYTPSSSIPPKRNPIFYNSSIRNEAFQQEDVGLNEEDDDLEVELSNTQSGHYYLYNEELKKHPKKRKLGELGSLNYGFDARGSREGWGERESFLLLEVWGERFLELGRRSLRGEDWVDVAEKVSEMSGERDVMECRSQMDVLKKKYKKERAKMEQVGGGFVSSWVFFKKMDVMLNLRMRGHGGLGCGVDSGEYVFMNPRVYLDQSNVLDEMRDSPVESDEEGEDEEGEGGRGGEEDLKSAKMLADSIQKFGEIYEKIETSKRKQMMDLEKMRMEFQMDLELQKKEIVERAQSEIAQLKEIGSPDDDEDDNDNDDGNDNDNDNGNDNDNDNDNGNDNDDGNENDDENGLMENASGY